MIAYLYPKSLGLKKPVLYLHSYLWFGLGCNDRVIIKLDNHTKERSKNENTCLYKASA